MIAVDTNVLARFYCDDPDDPKAPVTFDDRGFVRRARRLEPAPKVSLPEA